MRTHALLILLLCFGMKLLAAARFTVGRGLSPLLRRLMATAGTEEGAGLRTRGSAWLTSIFSDLR
jgi:hypothetical protein